MLLSQVGTPQLLAVTIAVNCGRRASGPLLCLGTRKSAPRPPARQAGSAGFSPSRLPTSQTGARGSSLDSEPVGKGAETSRDRSARSGRGRAPVSSVQSPSVRDRRGQGGGQICQCPGVGAAASSSQCELGHCSQQSGLHARLGDLLEVCERPDPFNKFLLGFN